MWTFYFCASLTLSDSRGEKSCHANTHTTPHTHKLTAPTISCSTCMVKKNKKPTTAQLDTAAEDWGLGGFFQHTNFPLLLLTLRQAVSLSGSLNASLGSQGPSAKSGQRRMWRGGGAKNCIKNKHEEEGHWKGMGALLNFNFTYLFWMFRKIEKI